MYGLGAFQSENHFVVSDAGFDHTVRVAKGDSWRITVCKFVERENRRFRLSRTG